MKLYFSRGACSLVVRIIMNEIGLNCDFEAVNLKTKTTETDKDFLKINPKGAVPTLELADGSVLTENAVILQYLCDSSKNTALLPPIGEIKRYRVLEWVNYITTELHKSIGLLFNPAVTEQIKKDLVLPIINRKFDFINQHLKTNQYLMGDQFTLPDAYLFVMLLWSKSLKLDLKEFDKLTAYFDILGRRKSVQLSLQQEGIGA